MECHAHGVKVRGEAVERAVEATGVAPADMGRRPMCEEVYTITTLSNIRG